MLVQKTEIYLFDSIIFDDATDGNIEGDTVFDFDIIWFHNTNSSISSGWLISAKVII